MQDSLTLGFFIQPVHPPVPSLRGRSPRGSRSGRARRSTRLSRSLHRRASRRRGRDDHLEPRVHCEPGRCLPVDHLRYRRASARQLPPSDGGGAGRHGRPSGSRPARARSGARRPPRRGGDRRPGLGSQPKTRRRSSICAGSGAKSRRTGSRASSTGPPRRARSIRRSGWAAQSARCNGRIRRSPSPRSAPTAVDRTRRELAAGPGSRPATSARTSSGPHSELPGRPAIVGPVSRRLRLACGTQCLRRR